MLVVASTALAGVTTLLLLYWCRRRAQHSDKLTMGNSQSDKTKSEPAASGPLPNVTEQTRKECTPKSDQKDTTQTTSSAASYVSTQSSPHSPASETKDKVVSASKTSLQSPSKVLERARQFESGVVNRHDTPSTTAVTGASKSNTERQQTCGGKVASTKAALLHSPNPETKSTASGLHNQTPPVKNISRNGSIRSSLDNDQLKNKSSQILRHKNNAIESAGERVRRESFERMLSRNATHVSETHFHKYDTNMDTYGIDSKFQELVHHLSKNTNGDIITSDTNSAVLQHPAFQEMMRSLKTTLTYEHSQRLRAEEWSDFLLLELEAHIGARIKVEECLEAARQRIEELERECEALRDQSSLGEAGEEVGGTVKENIQIALDLKGILPRCTQEVTDSFTSARRASGHRGSDVTNDVTDKERSSAAHVHRYMDKLVADFWAVERETLASLEDYRKIQEQRASQERELQRHEDHVTTQAMSQEPVNAREATATSAIERVSHGTHAASKGEKPSVETAIQSDIKASLDGSTKCDTKTEEHVFHDMAISRADEGLDDSSLSVEKGIDVAHCSLNDSVRSSSHDDSRTVSQAVKAVCESEKVESEEVDGSAVSENQADTSGLDSNHNQLEVSMRDKQSAKDEIDTSRYSVENFDYSPCPFSPSYTDKSSVCESAKSEKKGFSFDDILQANLDYLSSDDDLDMVLNATKTSTSSESKRTSRTQGTDVIKNVDEPMHTLEVKCTLRPSSSMSKLSPKSAEQSEMKQSNSEVRVCDSTKFWNEKLSKPSRDKVSDLKPDIDDEVLENIQKAKLKWEEIYANNSGNNSLNASGSHSRRRSLEGGDEEAEISSGKLLQTKLLWEEGGNKTPSCEGPTTPVTSPAIRKMSIEDGLDQPDIKQAKAKWENFIEDKSNGDSKSKRVLLVSKSEFELEYGNMSLDVNADSIANVSSTKSKWEHLLRDDESRSSFRRDKDKRGTRTTAANFGQLLDKFELRQPDTEGDSTDC